MFLLKCSGSVVIGYFSSLKFKTQCTFSSHGCFHSGSLSSMIMQIMTMKQLNGIMQTMIGLPFPGLHGNHNCNWQDQKWLILGSTFYINDRYLYLIKKKILSRVHTRVQSKHLAQHLMFFIRGGGKPYFIFRKGKRKIGRKFMLQKYCTKFLRSTLWCFCTIYISVKCPSFPFLLFSGVHCTYLVVQWKTVKLNNVWLAQR